MINKQAEEILYKELDRKLADKDLEGLEFMEAVIKQVLLYVESGIKNRVGYVVENVNASVDLVSSLVIIRKYKNKVRDLTESCE